MAASIAQFTGLRSAASFVGAKAEKGLPSVACTQQVVVESPPTVIRVPVSLCAALLCLLLAARGWSVTAVRGAT